MLENVIHFTKSHIVQALKFIHKPIWPLQILKKEETFLAGSSREAVLGAELTGDLRAGIYSLSVSFLLEHCG